jgi:hypothetical protein
MKPQKATSFLLICLLMFSAAAILGSVDASESVTGLIASDTTWTAQGSPYHFTGPVCVLEGATLNVEPGVTVDFDKYYLRVNGTLHAVGTPSQPVTLTADKEQQNPMQQIQFTAASTSYTGNSGCILQNVVLNHVSVDIKGSSPKISNCVFVDPFWVTILSRGGSPVISDNTFQQVSYEGVSVDKSAAVTGNLFNITTGFATAIVAHEHSYIANNKIIGYYNGINAADSTTVTGNAIVGCTNAGGVTGGSVDFSRNYLSDNHIGISICEGANGIQNNAVLNNDIGLQILSSSSAGTAQNNNIVGSKQYSVSMESTLNVDLPNNWWGTTDADAINQTIRDFKVDFNLGKVNFVPFLTSANPNAPASADIDLNSIPVSAPTAMPTSNPTEQSTDIPQQQDSSQSVSQPDAQPFSLDESMLAIVVVLVVLVLSIVVVVVLVRRK